MLIALIRRQVASFLGGAALAGIGLSLLMDTQDIALVKDTLLEWCWSRLGWGSSFAAFCFANKPHFKPFGALKQNQVIWHHSL